MTKKHILLLTTGGTIACTSGDQGLEPRNSGVMQFALEQLRSFYDKLELELALISKPEFE